MSINIGTLDIGVAFAGDTSGLQKATADAQQGIDRFGATTSKAMRQVREDTKGVEDALGRLNQGFKGAVIGSSVAVGLIKLKNTAIEVGDALIQAQVQLDKLNNGFKFGAGGAAGGARELAFVREEANRLGLEIGGAATQYMKMVAAARGTNMEGEKTRALFTSIAEASTVMGMSGEQSERAMMAIVQMMSKGKVQAEELRGQLGEHLPGAFAIAARAIGVTEVELNKLMETGSVMSADFLPKFAAQLRSELGGSVEDATKSMQASLNRFETAWLTFKQNVAQTGIAKVMGGEISAISDAITASSDAMDIARKSGATGFMQAMSGIGNAIGRVGFDTLSGSFNVVNGTLNTASLGALRLKTNIDLLPDAFRTSAQQVQLMGQKIVQAEAEYAVLSERLKQAPENIYIKSELTALARYISELERARDARDNLAGGDARQRTGSVSESRISAISDAEALKTLQAQGRAYEQAMKDMAGPQEKLTEALFKYKASMGDIYTPAFEAMVRKHFIKPTHEAKEKLDDFTKSAMRGQTLFGDLMATDGGLAKDFAEKWADLSAAAAKYGKTTDELAAAQAVLLSQQPFYKKGLQDEADALKEQTRATAEAAKVEQNLIDAAERGAASVLGKLQALQDEEKALVIAAAQNISLAQAIEEVEIARLREQQTALMREGDRDSEVLAIQQEIDARKKLKAAIGVKEGREAAADEAKRAADAWQKASEQIEKDITDALMRGFESGKGFAEVLRDTVANMFKTLVLRPIVSAVVSPVSGAITGSLGLAGAANAATGAGNLMGAGAGLYNSFATSSVGGSLGLSVPYVDVLGAGAAEAGIMTSAGSSLGAALPWIGGGLAVLSLLKSLDDSGTYHTGGLGSYSAAGGVAVGDAVKGQGLGFDLGAKDYTASSQQAAAALAQSVVGMLDSTANTFGAQAGYYAATAFADDTSKDGAWGQLMLKLGDQVLIDWKNGADKWPGREFADGEAGAKEYAAAISVAVRDQLITQVPDWADAALKALGDAPTLDQLGAVVAQINAAAAAMAGMGKASTAFAGLSEAATAALIKALGGADASAASLGSYYTNFYSDAERKAVATKQLTASLGELGVASLPQTRAEYRALIDAANAAGNTDLAAGLIKLSGGFASITDEAAAATDAVASVADSLKTLQNNALRGLESAVSREKQIYQAQVSAASEAASTMRGLFDLLAGNIRDLYAEAAGPSLTAYFGNKIINDALSAARTTGYMPEQGTLSDAIAAARGGLGMEQYASVAEQQYAQKELANRLLELQGLTGEQLTAAEIAQRTAESQLEALDATLEYWKQQIDLSQGNITATLSVADAITALQDAIKPGSTPAGKAAADAKSAAADGSGGFSSGPGKPYTGPGSNSGFYEASVGYYDGLAAIGDYYSSMSGWDNPQQQLDNIMALYNQADLMNVSVDQLSAGIGIPADDIQQVLADLGLPPLRELAVGTNYVPRDGVAYLHEGEAVVPKAYNPAAGGAAFSAGGAAPAVDTRRMEQLLADMAARLAAIEATSRQHAAQFDQVTEGGNAMRNTAIA